MRRLLRGLHPLGFEIRLVATGCSIHSVRVKNCPNFPAPWQGLVGSLQDIIAAHYKGRLCTLAVYGSVGRGTASPDSDIDILIIADDLPNGRSARIADFSQIETRWQDSLRLTPDMTYPPLLSPLIKTPAEAKAGSPLFLDMVEDAILLIDREGFFQSILDQMKAKMIENGSVRVWRGNAWYWDLKPGHAFGETIHLI